MATTLTERFRFVSPVETEHPFHVTNFTGVEGLHRLFDFHIDLVCADAAVDTGKLLAAPCRFEILRDGDAAPAIFSGYPARVEQRGFFNGYAYYSVHLRPTLWKLTRIRQSAIFLGKKLEDVLRRQLRTGLAEVSAEAAARVAVAYEPVWAIGTGKVAGSAEVLEAHALARRLLVEVLGSVAHDIPLLYGGSVKPDNAASLLALDNVNGLLIGGASLEAESFLRIAGAR